jgi:hypothetical protein
MLGHALGPQMHYLLPLGFIHMQVEPRPNNMGCRKMKCYWEHLTKHIGNVGNHIGKNEVLLGTSYKTHQEHGEPHWEKLSAIGNILQNTSGTWGTTLGT